MANIRSPRRGTIQAQYDRAAEYRRLYAAYDEAQAKGDIAKALSIAASIDEMRYGCE